jgi:hypothetical protein
LYRDITGYANIAVSYPTNVTAINIALPSTLQNSVLVKCDVYYTLSGLVTTGGGVGISLSGNMGTVGSSVFSNSSGILSFGNNNNLSNSSFLEFQINWQAGVTAGNFVLQSYVITLRK